MIDFLRDSCAALEDSVVESARFGLQVARITVPMSADVSTTLPWLRETLVEATHDLVVLRYPARHTTWFASLLATGYDVLHADSLIYFTRPLDSSLARPETALSTRTGPWTATWDSEIDPTALRALISATFSTFSNHYSANPLIDPTQALAGYQEWVTDSLDHDRVLCVSDEVGPAAFLTWSDHGPVCQFKLGGVHPRAQGSGLFSQVLLFAAHAGLRAGCREVDSPTQAHNLRQLAVSWKIGLRAAGACNTLHLVRTGLLTAQNG